MPKTPESGGIPLPQTWPPFTRSTWDARAQSLITSLGRMGHENEGYAYHEARVYLDPDGGGTRSPSSGGGTTGDNHASPPVEQENHEEVEPTRLLHTYAQRRAFVVKSMDLHRHTIGGGRSGRRGRAECVAFLRRVIEMLDEQREEAEALLGVDEEGGGVGSEFGEGELVSSSEEEEEGEESEEEEEEEEEEGGGGGEEEAETETADKVNREAETTNASQAETPNQASTTKTAVKTTPSTKKANSRTVILNEEDFFDQHNDLCEVCNLPGELLCCATCNLVFHTKCARPKLVKEPDDDWKCAYCIAEGVTGGKKEGRERKRAIQACREMEKARKELKEQKEEVPSVDEDGKKSDDDKADEPSAEVTQDDTGNKEEAREIEKQSIVKSEEDRPVTPVEQTTPKSEKLAEPSTVQSEESLKVKASSRSSTPCRELEDLTSVPKHLQVDEHEVLYSVTGRIQRNRKKPTIYDPKTGPDSDWKSENINDKSTEAATDKTSDTAGAPAHDTAAPKKRGPKPGRKKKKKAKKPPKKPPKKKILPDTEGVGILNRLPGTLFDCSVCLDITKIKLCCYCACRVCFNKFGKEQTILCDKCDQEYHTFCLNPPMKKLPEEEVEWVCPACIDDEKKKKSAEARKAAAAAKRAEEDRKKAEFDEKRQVQADKRKAAFEAKKAAVADTKKKATDDVARPDAVPPKSSDISSSTPQRKKSPGRPRLTPPAPTSVASSTSNVPPTGDDQPPKKRGRGRPRKDGRDPIPRQVQTVQPTPIPVDVDDTNVERSRSGRKIHRTIFHDEVNGGRGNRPDAKRPKKGSPSDTAGTSEALEMTQATSFSSSGFLERSAAAAAKSAIAGATKVGPRRKPGARECMQMSRKFGANVIEQKYFDVLMDYSKRGKVDHLIRMRERLDDHARFLESQLAGLEALVQEKEEISAKAEPDDLKDV
ncbi:hypothetical protein HJC23_002309 [Cyclotella cryptica]|uniref:PHD-type domain-containing protein n=1 Tax=Cyclotella cryptica TaxID=29204 RepID=A0ABD3QM39_9STRA